MSTGKNKMSVLQLTILTAVNMMGSGIIMLPTKLAQVGSLSIVSWLITAVGSMPNIPLARRGTSWRIIRMACLF